MRIAQVSDFHFTHLTWNPFRLLSKRFFGHFNWIFTRDRDFSPSQIEPLIHLFTELKVDLVLLGGDFTTTSLPEEFQTASKFVHRLKQPWIAIPGNHDRYTYETCKKKTFYRYFSNPLKEGPFSLFADRVEAHRAAPGWWVVALDTSRATPPASSRGIFPLETEQKLEQILSRIPQGEKVILFNHYPFFAHDAHKRGLERGPELEALIRRHPEICLYLHGHTHRHMIADLQVSGLPILLDSGSCSQGPRGTWNLIDLDEKKCAVSAYRWNRGWYKARSEELLWTR